MWLRVDSGFGPAFARALHLLVEPEHRVDHVRLVPEYEGEDPGDPTWLRDFQRAGGDCVLTQDDGIRTQRERREAYGELRVIYFQQPKHGPLRPIDAMATIAKHWEKLLALVDGSRPGSVIELGVTRKPKRIIGSAS